MRGVAKQRKMAARFGPKWWDRNGHVSFWSKEDPVWRTWSEDEYGVFEWPRPCNICDVVDWVDDETMPREETLARFEALKPELAK